MNRSGLIRTGRLLYEALAWSLVGLGFVFVVLPGLLVFDLVRIHETLPVKPLMLGFSALLAWSAWLGRFSVPRNAAVAPLVLAAIVGLDYGMAATGCVSLTGLHPVNALGVAALGLGVVRTMPSWSEEAGG